MVMAIPTNIELFAADKAWGIEKPLPVTYLGLNVPTTLVAIVSSAYAGWTQQPTEGKVSFIISKDGVNIGGSDVALTPHYRTGEAGGAILTLPTYFFKEEGTYTIMALFSQPPNDTLFHTPSQASSTITVTIPEVMPTGLIISTYPSLGVDLNTPMRVGVILKDALGKLIVGAELEIEVVAPGTAPLATSGITNRNGSVMVDVPALVFSQIGQATIIVNYVGGTDANGVTYAPSTAQAIRQVGGPSPTCSKLYTENACDPDIPGLKYHCVSGTWTSVEDTVACGQCTTGDSVYDQTCVNGTDIPARVCVNRLWQNQTIPCPNSPLCPSQYRSQMDCFNGTHIWLEECTNGAYHPSGQTCPVRTVCSTEHAEGDCTAPGSGSAYHCGADTQYGWAELYTDACNSSNNDTGLAISPLLLVAAVAGIVGLVILTR